MPDAVSRKFRPAVCHPTRTRITADGRCESCYRKDRPRRRKPAVCHPDRPAVAKGWCLKCYDQQRVKKPRPTLATNCPHTDRPHRAHGLCDQCYTKLRISKDPAARREWYRQWRLAHPGAAAAATRRSYQKHREKRQAEGRAQGKIAYAKDPRKFIERQRPITLRGKYKMTEDGFQARLAYQQAACAICMMGDPSAGNKRVKRFCVDHVDVAGMTVVRGLLCYPCNIGLGLLRDDAAILLRAADYLDRSPESALPYPCSAADYEVLLRCQRGQCAICFVSDPPRQQNRRRPLDEDHDHQTGLTRGLLCPLCNKALGKFQHAPAVLRAAARYLELWGKEGRVRESP